MYICCKKLKMYIIIFKMHMPINNKNVFAIFFICFITLHLSIITLLIILLITSHEVKICTWLIYLRILT